MMMYGMGEYDSCVSPAFGSDMNGGWYPKAIRRKDRSRDGDGDGDGDGEIVMVHCWRDSNFIDGSYTLLSSST